MGTFATFSLLIVIAALFAYVNFRVLKLPSSIGLMFLALLFSVLLVAVGKMMPHVLGDMQSLVQHLDHPDKPLPRVFAHQQSCGNQQWLPRDHGDFSVN